MKTLVNFYIANVYIVIIYLYLQGPTMLLNLNSRTFQDPQDIFPDFFCNPTTYKFTEKLQPLITSILKT